MDTDVGGWDTLCAWSEDALQEDLDTASVGWASRLRCIRMAVE